MVLLRPIPSSYWSLVGAAWMALMSAGGDGGCPNVWTFPAAAAAAAASEAAAAAASETTLLSPFEIIIDGGSTGSRLHVFEFVTRIIDDGDDNDDCDDDNDRSHSTCSKRGRNTCSSAPCDNNSNHTTTPTTRTETVLVRRGSARADIPLSAFGRMHDQRHEPINATAVAEHMIPAFRYAATAIPAAYHSTTRVRYQATAGMRLLDLLEQEAVYDALYEGLMQHPDFVFTALRRDDIATLSGELEGYYGVVAANYLHGVVNAQLEFVGSLQQQQQQQADVASAVVAAPIGALDMGGSSTQIVFLPSSGSSSNPQQRQQYQVDSVQDCLQEVKLRDTNDDNDSTDENDSTCHVASSNELQPLRLNGQDFFSTSYLSYGVDQIRERLWNLWIQEHQQEQQNNHHATNATCDAKIIHNPCFFRGYWTNYQGYMLIGTGDTESCMRQVRRLIPHPELPDYNNSDKSGSTQSYMVGGIQHPAVRGKFFAMSLYFFALDALRILSDQDPIAHAALNRSWPTPSIQELENALPGLCSRAWYGDLQDIAETAHMYTRPAMLPHRCLETVYMVTLLKEGFGFAPESRDITFAFLVDGSEVEWTLGMALALHAQENEQQGEEEEFNNIDTASAIPVSIAQDWSLELSADSESSNDEQTCVACYDPSTIQMDEDDEDTKAALRNQTSYRVRQFEDDDDDVDNLADSSINNGGGVMINNINTTPTRSTDSSRRQPPQIHTHHHHHHRHFLSQHKSYLWTVLQRAKQKKDHLMTRWARQWYAALALSSTS